MFGKLTKDETEGIDNQIGAVLSEMSLQGPSSEEFPKLLTYLERLRKLKTHERQRRVNPDTMASIAGNLAGILLIVAYEQKHVMTSKALSHIRPR